MHLNSNGFDSIFKSLKSIDVCCGINFNVMVKPDEYYHIYKYGLVFTQLHKGYKKSNQFFVEFLDH